MDKQINCTNAFQVVNLPDEHQRISKYFIHGLSCKTVERPWGTVVIYFWRGNHYKLSFTYLMVNQTKTLCRKVTEPLVELMVPFTSTFSFERNGELHTYKKHQYNLLYAPCIQDRVQLQAGDCLGLFRISLLTSFLKSFAEPFACFESFLQQLKENKESKLHSHPLFLNAEMVGIINDIKNQNLAPDMLHPYLEVKTKEFLVWLLIRARQQPFSATNYTPGEEQIAQRARELIDQDFEKFYTIKQLARLIGTNENKLKIAFKRLHGTTIFNYSIQARLQHAKLLLRQTDLTLQHIALAVGYPDASNFSVAFKRQYGYAPGYLKKRIF
jgi:AraC family transcriptional regulator, transcriptional activator of the genes for pyochelin and ferripyochelin receptors